MYFQIGTLEHKNASNIWGEKSEKEERKEKVLKEKEDRKERVV